MDFVPQSRVMLLGDVPLDNTYRDTLTFDSIDAQFQYFSSKVRASFEYNEFTYQRVQRAVRVPANAEKLWDVNYMMFQNSNYGSRWFYAFVTDVRYVSPETTEVSFEIDDMQSWVFLRTIHPSFVVREHVNNDAIGANLIDEGLATGEPYIWWRRYDSLGTDIGFVMASTVNAAGEPETGGVYGGIYSGAALYGYNRQEGGEINQFIASVTEAGKAEGIVAINTIPAKALELRGSDKKFQPGSTLYSDTTNPLRNTDFEGYVPKNNKLFCYPYSYLQVQTVKGASMIYRWEYFGTYTPSFNVIGSVSLNPELICIPLHYAGASNPDSYLLTLGGFPSCSWNSDGFKNWYAQNQLSTTMGMIGSAFAGGIPTNPVSAVTQVGSNAFNVLSQIAGLEDRSVRAPIHSGGQGASGIFAATQRYNFEFVSYAIKRDFAVTIDNYFSMYGYKVNKLKVPNIVGRKEWNYVQTSGAMITGTCPFSAISHMRQILDKGITFWHNPANVGNYDLDNSIVGGGTNGTTNEQG